MPLSLEEPFWVVFSLMPRSHTLPLSFRAEPHSLLNLA